MTLPYAARLSFVQAMAPTRRKPPQANLADVLAALPERPRLCRSELARARPRANQPWPGRRGRLRRFLDHRRLGEAALFRRWLKRSYRCGAHRAPARPAGSAPPAACAAGHNLG